MKKKSNIVTLKLSESHYDFIMENFNNVGDGIRFIINIYRLGII